MHVQVCVAAAGLWTSPQAARQLDELVLGHPADLSAWAAAQGPAERRQLWGRLDTQVLLGETVIVDQIDDGWARVIVPDQPSRRDHRGYPGYLPLAQLAEAATPTGERVVVTVPVTEVLAGPGGAVLIPDVSYATVLPSFLREAGGVWVALPGGGRGWLPDAAVAPYAEGGPLPTAKELLGEGRQFLGLMYLAGGLASGSGLDCSGLIHALYRRFGLVVPRDAADMAGVGDEVPLEKLAPGDLMFFRKPDTGFVYHVGICAEVIDGWPSMLQASQTDWDTIDTPITELRHGHLHSARRLRS
ncbi:hypothetical protein F4553_006153 [Allocatelliglobosispora scoriae]|uniref:NlpC/P60 domain-containing protein n=1 Tax=Allocatelliglobosispora scoriae TaxID=643052 RepID=A0A841C047_9ACTN|nr:NlpC/P60 family protein [Allocatelliglobosispora scoriae]MBB5872719.1 hypothetical protein [Allocatelliglobosispora scoriae]